MGEAFTWGFAAGRDNPIGLRLEFKEGLDGHEALFVPREEHQGYAGIVHGGIIATIMDEAMGDHVYRLSGEKAPTARLELRYLKAVPIRQQLRVVATVARRKGRMYETKGELFLQDGSLAVEAAGKFFVVNN